MDIKIQDLNISPNVKNDLQNAGFTKVSELIGHNYITLAPKFPHRYDLQSIINELNPLGYLLPPENEISIYDITMSKRLYNILERNNIIYLSQLSAYPKEEIMQFRNLGERTLAELEGICQKHNIHIGSIESIKKNFIHYDFPSGAYAMFFKSNISCIDDFSHKTTHDLYDICSHDYILTMKVYYILKRNGVVFDNWDDSYLFEFTNEKKATKLYNRYKLKMLSQLYSLSSGELKKLYNVSPELFTALNLTDS